MDPEKVVQELSHCFDVIIGHQSMDTWRQGHLYCLMRNSRTFVAASRMKYGDSMVSRRSMDCRMVSLAALVC